jgi:hypothetical protein
VLQRQKDKGAKPSPCRNHPERAVIPSSLITDTHCWAHAHQQHTLTLACDSSISCAHMHTRDSYPFPLQRNAARSLRACAHTHTHTYTHTHTRAHTHARARTHTHTHTHARTLLIRRGRQELCDRHGGTDRVSRDRHERRRHDDNHSKGREGQCAVSRQQSSSVALAFVSPRESLMIFWLLLDAQSNRGLASTCGRISFIFSLLAVWLVAHQHDGGTAPYT